MEHIETTDTDDGYVRQAIIVHVGDVDRARKIDDWIAKHYGWEETPIARSHEHVEPMVGEVRRSYQQVGQSIIVDYSLVGSCAKTVARGRESVSESDSERTT
ncbi:MAG: hypothetical protein BMS9Abin37_2801 [Acidobacteriota bacterium]|nr:MAG: hypothetical protein BMS9Abin37_2801 [Acidobacteriota bacterium]